MRDEELVWLGAGELGRRVAAGEATSKRITEAFLARIAEVNPLVEAYVTVTAEIALAQAARCDLERERGHLRGPLHGVPFCLKDIVATQGVRTTAGSQILSDWVPARTATVAKRLVDAGAVLLGKVNTHEFAFGVTTWNTHAKTRNPWLRSRIAGGSSGGSGAAVAAGLAPFSIGSDTAGSIRIPAAFCGVAGLKPTYGLVSAAGVVAQSYTADHVGPMARSVEDLAIVLGVIAGPDAEDPNALPYATPDYAAELDRSIEGARIGIPEEAMRLPLSPAVAEAFERAQQVFRDLGAEIRNVSVPLLERASEINNAIVPPETAEQHLAWAQSWFRERPIRYGDDVAALLEWGGAVPATSFIRASRERALLREALTDALSRDVDLLLTPTCAIAAPQPDRGSILLGGKEYDVLGVMIHFLCAYSITGLPALAIPAGWDAEGLPLSVQLIGRQRDDARVLAAGRAYEIARPWSKARPSLS
jgi:aspartyl-tRNA(Asn)/glutamyl-tRNA(Gln) amidotransferase subunit A